MADLKPNAGLAYKVLAHIDANPKEWDQATWKCGTAYCFGGWSVVLAGGTVNYNDGNELRVVDGPDELLGVDVEEAAYRALNIDAAESWVNDFEHEKFGLDTGWLFSGANTLTDLRGMVERIFGPRPAPDGA